MAGDRARARLLDDDRASRCGERDRDTRGHARRTPVAGDRVVVRVQHARRALVGAAVADTIAGIVTVAPSRAVAVIGAGLAGAVVWNLITWRLGLPSSSGHALVGGLVGSALAEAGVDGVNWGGMDGWRPVGVIGVLIALAVSPVIGLVFGFVFVRLIARFSSERDAGATSDPRGGVDDVGCALVRSRCQRCSESDGSDRRLAPRDRPSRARCRYRSGFGWCVGSPSPWALRWVAGGSCERSAAESSGCSRATGSRARARRPP